MADRLLAGYLDGLSAPERYMVGTVPQKDSLARTVLIVLGIPVVVYIIVMVVALIVLEADRNEMRAECYATFTSGSAELAECLTAADRAP